METKQLYILRDEKQRSCHLSVCLRLRAVLFNVFLTLKRTTTFLVVHFSLLQILPEGTCLDCTAL